MTDEVCVTLVRKQRWNKNVYLISLYIACIGVYANIAVSLTYNIFANENFKPSSLRTLFTYYRTRNGSFCSNRFLFSFFCYISRTQSLVAAD